LTHEYQRAVQTYDLDYQTVKGISRNALQYSFLDGAALFKNPKIGRLTESCSKGLPADIGDGSTCAEFISQSQKATIQWELERRFALFEAAF